MKAEVSVTVALMIVVIVVVSLMLVSGGAFYAGKFCRASTQVQDSSTNKRSEDVTEAHKHVKAPVAKKQRGGLPPSCPSPKPIKAQM